LNIDTSFQTASQNQTMAKTLKALFDALLSGSIPMALRNSPEAPPFGGFQEEAAFLEEASASRVPEPRAGLQDAAGLRKSEDGGGSNPKSGANRSRRKIANTDADLLELLLGLINKDVKHDHVIHDLLQRFGSFAGVLSASEKDLMEFAGVGAALITTIQIIKNSAVALVRSEILDRPVLSNWDRLMDYLQAVLSREPVEHCRALFLNRHYHLMHDELHSRGTVDRATISSREVIKRALELHASAFIVVHHYPGGSLLATPEEVRLAADLQTAGRTLGLTLQDYVIMSSGGWFSFRRENLLQFPRIP
jgi:DNA repair protein RadC